MGIYDYFIDYDWHTIIFFAFLGIIYGIGYFQGRQAGFKKADDERKRIEEKKKATAISPLLNPFDT